MSNDPGPKPYSPPSPNPARQLDDKQIQTWIWIGAATLILIAAYWNSFQRVAAEWQRPEYSHGYLIPAFAAVLLWMRREAFPESFADMQRWIGVGLLAFGISIRVIAARRVMPIVDDVSFIPCVLGVFLMFGGMRTLRWAGPPIAFLIFMYPLPGVLRDNILRPLQTLATRCSVFAMQTLGVEVYAEGNVIHLEKMDMNVVDACSGLRMLTIFLALAVAIVMIVNNRPIWERLIILISAVPVALLVNVIRITVTGLLYNMEFSSDIAHKFFHDFAGYIMMPMALGFLYLELQVLARLVVETEPVQVGQAGFVPKVSR